MGKVRLLPATINRNNHHALEPAGDTEPTNAGTYIPTNPADTAPAVLRHTRAVIIGACQVVRVYLYSRVGENEQIMS